MQFKLHSKTMKQRQAGAVLIVALVMVLLMTIVGVSAIKGSNLQELMAGNVRDKQISFQAAEAALRDAEASVNGVNPPNIGGATVGFVEQIAAGSVSSHWRNNFVWFDKTTQFSVLTDMDLKMIHDKPRYVVEKLDVTYVPGSDGRAVDLLGVQNAPEIMIYRITGRGVGVTDSSITYLQSLYRRQ